MELDVITEEELEGKTTSGRYWCFTFNNPEWTPDTTLQEAYTEGRIRYAVFQGEISESGTYHFQGFISLCRAQRLSFMRKLMPGCHLSLARNAIAAEAYCRKDDTRNDGPYTIGVWEPEKVGSGKRSDLLKLRDAVREGRTIKELIENDELAPALLRHGRAYERLIELYGGTRDWITELHIMFGPPGVGKTTHVLDKYPGAYWKQPSTGWWDGYTGQRDVVLDEFKGWLPFHWLLRLADRSPLIVEVKGGQRIFLARRLVIISNFTPTEWYNQTDAGKWAALFRRITTFTWMKSQDRLEIYNSYADFETVFKQENGLLPMSPVL